MKICKKCKAEYDDKEEKCPKCGETEFEEKKEDKAEKAEKKSLDPKKKRIIIIAAVAAVVIAGIIVAIINLLPEKTPDNGKEVESAPDAISLDGGKVIEDVTAITGSVDKNGKVIDAKGIIDKEGHRIYNTGYKSKNGKIIYTTGKKDAKGNILYTLNEANNIGKLIYYTGTVKDGKLQITRTDAIPDYTTKENSKLVNRDRYSTTKTVEYKPNKNEVSAKSLTKGFTSYFGGSGDDVVKKVVAVKDGYIVTGHTLSKNGFFEGAGESWKNAFGFVAKIDTNGSVVWKYMTGGNSNIMLRDVCQLKDGSVVAVGETTATDTAAPKTGIAVATLIVKLDKKGEEVWSYTLPCNEEENGDMGYSVAATPDGGFLVGGEAESTTGLFKNSEGKFKAFLFKFSKKGDIKWRKVLGGSKDNRITAIAVNSNGDIFATCLTYSTDTDFAVLKPYKTPDLTSKTVVLKLDKNGNLLWSAPVAGSGKSEYSSVAVTEDGGCIIGGTMSLKRSYGSYSQCYGKTDGYVIRFTKDGKVYWARNIGGKQSDSVTGVTVTSKGIVVVGYTKSNDMDFAGLISSGNKDGFIMVLNGAGQTTGKMLTGGSADDVIYSVTSNESGIVTAGVTGSANGIFKDAPTGKRTTGFAMFFTLNDK